MVTPGTTERRSRRSPVAGGLVESLARPGGNTTGFTSAEYGHEREMAGVAAPRVTRTAVLFEADNHAAITRLSAIQAVAPSLGVELIPVGLRDAVLARADEVIE